MPKVITLKQPWAQLVIQGHKQFETRGFQTSYRGELYIHSSGHFNTEFIELCYTEPFKSCIKSPHYLRCGYIIGKVDLVKCESTSIIKQTLIGSELGEREIAFGDYGPGRFAWLLEHPVIFERPIKQKGALSIWEYPYHIEEHI